MTGDTMRPACTFTLALACSSLLLPISTEPPLDSTSRVPAPVPVPVLTPMFALSTTPLLPSTLMAPLPLCTTACTFTAPALACSSTLPLALAFTAVPTVNAPLWLCSTRLPPLALLSPLCAASTTALVLPLRPTWFTLAATALMLSA